ncbi:MAG TPA: DUF3592 domain-containing protein [Pirellulales bacterium]|nr:DUF3592 domain-containing protein [Pirellulales bacterium]
MRGGSAPDSFAARGAGGESVAGEESGIVVAARSFRMYGKKRGHRRTGSSAWGSLGEAVVFVFFLALGSVFLVLLLRMPVLPEWRANHDFVQTTGTVLEKRVGETPGLDGTSYRAEILIRYAVGEKQYEALTFDITFDSPWAYSSNRESRQAEIDQFKIATPCDVWYDPKAPATAVVVRGYSGWLWSLLLLPGSFIIIGGAGLIFALLHWGKSPEHLAAATQLAARLELFEESTPLAKDYPHVPRDANLTNSPGTRLKYRLPINTVRGWKLLAATFICFCWNGIVVGFVVMALPNRASGEAMETPSPTNWWLLLFTLPFLLVGLGMIYFLVRQVLIATGLGPTQLEISDHPLLPGRHYDLFLSQAGRLMIDSLEVDLVCDEQATYRQGTDTRTEQRRVCRQRVFDRRKFEIPQGMPFEQQCRIEIPADAMHSFSSDHNEVQWKFVVRGEIGGWPKYERSFPIVVFPRPAAISTKYEVQSAK